MFTLFGFTFGLDLSLVVELMLVCFTGWFVYCCGFLFDCFRFGNLVVPAFVWVGVTFVLFGLCGLPWLICFGWFYCLKFVVVWLIGFVICILVY